MKELNIYLSGGMADLTFEESDEWRQTIEHELQYDAVKVFNPNWYYNYENPEEFDTDKEVMDFDLYNLRRADLVIVNFNSPKSIGTAQELALAYEWKIPIVGLNTQGNELHPWLEIECTKMFEEMVDLIQYVKDYYLT